MVTVFAVDAAFVTSATLAARATTVGALDCSTAAYPIVKVANDEEFRAALTSADNKMVVVQNDITVGSEIDEQKVDEPKQEENGEFEERSANTVTQ